MHPITFRFIGKKIGHRLAPGTYEAQMLRTRFNKAGNLEMTLTDVRPAKNNEQKLS